MLEFTHSLTGGVIASKIGNPLIALPAALLSHFLVDLLPHWNPGLSKELKKYGRISQKTFRLVMADSFFGLFLGLILASRKLPDIRSGLMVVLGCFLAILPDLFEAPFYFLGWKNSRCQRLHQFQSEHQFKVSFWPGIISQIIYSLLLLYLVFWQ